jgi:hypothetical protein
MHSLDPCLAKLSDSSMNIYSKFNTWLTLYWANTDLKTQVTMESLIFLTQNNVLFRSEETSLIFKELKLVNFVENRLHWNSLRLNGPFQKKISSIQLLVWDLILVLHYTTNNARTMTHWETCLKILRGHSKLFWTLSKWDPPLTVTTMSSSPPHNYLVRMASRLKFQAQFNLQYLTTFKRL